MDGKSELPTFIFGFFTGFFLIVGVDPEEIMLVSLGETLEIISGIKGIKLLFYLLPTIFFILKIWNVYKSEEYGGLIIWAVGLVSGLLILTDFFYISIILTAIWAFYENNIKVS